MLDKIINGFDKFLDWLLVEPTKIPIFVDKETGVATISRLGAAFVIMVAVFIILLFICPKFRGWVFKALGDN